MFGKRKGPEGAGRKAKVWSVTNLVKSTADLLLGDRKYRRNLVALRESIGRPKVAREWALRQEAKYKAAFEFLSEVKAPIKLSAKERARFRQRKLQEFLEMNRRQKKELEEFATEMYKKLFRALYNPRKGFELEREFRGHPNYEKISKIIHDLARIEKAHTGRMISLPDALVPQVAEVREALTRIINLALAPKFRAEREEFKKGTAK